MKKCVCVYNNNQEKLIAWQEYLANLYRKKFRDNSEK